MAPGPEKFYEETNDDVNSGTWNSSQMYNGGFDGTDEPAAGTPWNRFLDSFKPAPHVKGAASTRVIPSEGGHKVYDVDAAAAATAQSPLARRLKGRHLQMIAIGGSIGETSKADRHARLTRLQVPVFS
jgi:hypothetical protein